MDTSSSYKTSMASTQNVPVLTHSSYGASDISKRYKTPTAPKPNMVQLQKDKLDMLLARLKSQESKISSFQNVHLFIQELEGKLKTEKSKNVQLETALVSAESQLVEWVKTQLDKPETILEIPPQLLEFNRSDASSSGKRTFADKYQQTEMDQEEIESRISQAVPSAKSAPDLSKCYQADDLDIDGEGIPCHPPIHPPKAYSNFSSLASSGRDSGYAVSLGGMSDASSGYHSRRTTQDLESLPLGSSSRQHIEPNSSILRERTVIQRFDKDTQTFAVSPTEYEDIINQQARELAKRKLHITQLYRLLEARSNNNCDVFSQQLSVALQKNEELSKSNKQKDVLLDHYAKAYTSLSEEVKTKSEDAALHSSQNLDALDKLQLKKLICDFEQDCNNKQVQIAEIHGQLLQQRQVQQDLEVKLKAAQTSVEELHRSRRTHDELPFTMGELRDENKYLKETLSLKEKTTAKLVQEKEHLIAQSDLLRTQQKDLKKHVDELSSKTKELQGKLDQNESQEDQYKRVQLELKNVQQELLRLRQDNKKLESDVTDERREKERESGRWHQQFKLMIEARKKIDDQLRGLQSQDKQSQRRIQQYKKQAEEQQQLILQLQGLSSKQQSSMKPQSSPAATGLPKWKQPPMQAVADSAEGEDAVVECPRCFRGFKISQYEKYEAHIKKCTDD